MRFIIHAGAGKCGSSSIQHALLSLERLLDNLHVRLLTHEDIHQLDVFHASGANLEGLIRRLKIPTKKGGCTVISSEYLLSRPFAVANLYSRLSAISKKVSIIYYTRDRAEFALSAFRYFFRHTPTTLDYLRSSSQLNGDIVHKIKPEISFLIAEACNNFRFLSAGVPRHLLWNEALLTIRAACGLPQNAVDRVIEVRIPEGFKNFDIVGDFLKRAKLDKNSGRIIKAEHIHSNQGPDALLVNSLLHYQLTGQISTNTRLPDDLPAATDEFPQEKTIKEVARADKATMDFFRMAAEEADSRSIRQIPSLHRKISLNTKKMAAFNAIRISAATRIYERYYLPLHIVKDLLGHR